MAIPGPLPRRLISVTATFTAAFALSALLPFALPAFLLVDWTRVNRWAGTRAFLSFWIFTQYEMWGILAATGTWIAGVLLKPDPATYIRWNRQLSARWGSGMLQWAKVLYSLDIQVTGEDEIRRPGPVLFLMRHSGVADTLVPPAIISQRNHRPVRYIVKSELLWDPCLDILGGRFPNFFVSRDGSDTAAQLAGIRRLTADMADDEGIILYPEGTRFTEKKRDRVIEKLTAAGDPTALARAQGLKRVLPPRRGGSLAVLQAAPQADVVIVANVGFEWATSKRQLWTGDFIGRTIRIDFRRIPAAEIPRDDDGALAWLGEQWLEVDRWVRLHEDR
jgi:1-acyl-sn-glycerol-3-phosphate acyltransferase